MNSEKMLRVRKRRIARSETRSEIHSPNVSKMNIGRIWVIRRDDAMQLGGCCEGKGTLLCVVLWYDLDAKSPHEVLEVHAEKWSA